MTTDTTETLLKCGLKTKLLKISSLNNIQSKVYFSVKSLAAAANKYRHIK